jgi:hypothetical protein
MDACTEVDTGQQLPSWFRVPRGGRALGGVVVAPLDWQRRKPICFAEGFTRIFRCQNEPGQDIGEILIAESSNHLMRPNTSLRNRGAATRCVLSKTDQFAGTNESFFFSNLSLVRWVGLQECIQPAILFPEEFLHSKVAIDNYLKA